MDAPQKYLSFKQAQAYLAQRGVRHTLNTLRQYRNAGHGPKFVRIGGRLHTTAADLDAWVTERANHGTSFAAPYWPGLCMALVLVVRELSAGRGTSYTWDQVQELARARGITL